MVCIKKNILLKDFSNYKIGGRAKYFLEVSSLPELKKGLAEWRRVSKESAVFVLGAGTNLLIDDRGFSGLVIHNKIKEIKILSDFNLAGSKRSTYEVGDIEILVGAGVLIEDLLTFCIKNSLSGLEWAGGLPGTLGGAVRGNAGAFAGEIKDAIVQIVSIANIANRKGNFAIKTRNKEECKFGYRSSVFKSQSEKKSGSQEIIVSATLKFQKGDKDLIKEKIEEKINYRKEKHPLEYPNIGSIFKNMPIEKVPQKLLEQLKDSIKDDPFPILPTAKLLAVAGLKGKKLGGAMVSQKHPNFIVNFNNASSENVLGLIKEIKKIIKEKYGITLEGEITILKKQLVD